MHLAIDREITGSNHTKWQKLMSVMRVRSPARLLGPFVKLVPVFGGRGPSDTDGA